MLTSATAWAQDPQFPNGTPIDYTKPFLTDGNSIRHAPVWDDAAIPVEVIGREELLTSKDPRVVELREMLERDKAVKAYPAPKPTQSEPKPSP